MTKSTGQAVKRELVLEDWNWLHETGQLDHADSLKHRTELAAPRMGMSVDALAQALRRAGIRNPAEPATVAPSAGRGEGRGELCQACRRYQGSLHRSAAELRMYASRLAEFPDSARLRANLERVQAERAQHEAVQAFHLDADHAETERVAA